MMNIGGKRMCFNAATFAVGVDKHQHYRCER